LADAGISSAWIVGGIAPATLTTPALSHTLDLSARRSHLNTTDLHYHGPRHMTLPSAPATKPGKRLILCCDGTWNRADQEQGHTPCPTNVVELAFRVAKRDGDMPQIVYYDQGVGTGNLVDRLSGGALGEGLLDNIHDAYRFLIGNYEPGDELFLFGFSRGAFTIRSLSGMIRKCGILRRDAVSKYREARFLYRNPEIRPDDQPAADFREERSVCGAGDIPIRFVGVWDTVGSLGIPLRGFRWFTRRHYQFHDTELSRCVKTACHALALNERRAPFVPTLWEYVPKEGQTVRQVWFCGAHSDVGGGYAQRWLSDIALEWMMERAGEAGLVFDPAVAKAYPLRPDYQAEIHRSMRSFYRLTRGVDRVVGFRANPLADPEQHARLPDPTQSVHDSVRQRWDEDPEFRPPGLLAYFKQINDPRGA
jgi:uncharacterized protein (DUF2235 family)